MGQLTTHVLDLVSGRPASAMTVELYEMTERSRRLAARTRTNVDGRCDEPLLAGARLKHGVWELDFHVAEYFAGLGIALSEPPFLDIVTIRFGISSDAEHYHVPLLVSPWAYSTYRGS